ncbi:MAG: hypothetical protein J0L69_12880 [Bacteroidetes bacterium]|nr:hypothetical protein [Bacteroidota bacterium]
MKQLLTSCFVLSFISLSSQNIKTKMWTMQYEYLPTVLPDSKYNTYKIFPESHATDGVPLDGKYMYVAEQYIGGLKNITKPEVKGGILIGGMVVGGKEVKTTPGEETQDLTINVSFGNIEIVDKVDYNSATTNPQTNATENLFASKIRFKFEYSIKVTDQKQNKVIFDTIINEPKLTVYPQDFKYNAYGDKAGARGFASKPELDLDYNQNSKNLYALAKKTLVKNCMDQMAMIVTSRYGYKSAPLSIHYYWVKSKNKIFDACDTTVDLMRAIVDTMETNIKYNRHLNWHCTSAKSNALKLIRIWEAMLNDSKYHTEFKDEKDLNEFKAKMRRNLVLAYLFNDDFEKAMNYYSIIEKETKYFTGNNYATDEPMKILKKLVEREALNYNKHKVFFGFQ